MGISDDLVYVGVLLSSIAAGKLVRYLPIENDDGFQLRRWVSTLLGVLFAFLVSGVHILHLLLDIFINAFIITFIDSRVCHLVSLTVSFLYLFLFRFSEQLGLPAPPPHTNAIIMILTLKLVGLAFEVHDSQSKEEDGSYKLPELHPEFLDVFHYGLSHVGLITGPYYKYRVWDGMYRDMWNPAVIGAREYTINEALYQRAKNVPLYVTAFLVTGYLFPLSAVEEEGWQESTSFLYKLFYMLPVFFNFRMRIYSGFCLSECACISAGLGAFPKISEPKPGQGPSKPEKLSTLNEWTVDQINFETVHNIDEWGSDFVPTMREALKCWNMTVQHWLVMVVYKRFPSRRFRTAAVMLMSSAWHGVYSGI